MEYVLAFLWMLVPAGQSAKPPAAPAASVATVNGAAIRAEELNEAVGFRVLRTQNEEYEIRRSVLDDLVLDRLMALGAKAGGLTVEEFKRAEIDAKVSVTDDEARSVYQAVPDRFTGMTEPEAIKVIRESIVNRKRLARGNALRRELTAQFPVQVLLQPPRATVDSTPGVARGRSDAPVTIVEFSDYECPYCARLTPVLRQLEDKYPGQVRRVFMDFPLPSHRDALAAAAAARCADDQGRYWEMHDLLFENQKALRQADLRQYAKKIGLTAETFEQCMSTVATADRVKAARSQGEKLGVQGTPTFLINGRMVSGAVPLDVLSQIIEDELAWLASTATRAATRH